MLKKFFNRSEFLTNVVTLFSGAAAAQLIPIVFSLWYARLYAPNEFGPLVLFLSFSSLLSIIITARYELAIMLPKEDGKAINVMALGWVIAFSIFIISLLAVFIYQTSGITFYKRHEVYQFIWLVPIHALIIGIYNSLTFWTTRKKNYKFISIAKVIQQVVFVGLIITLAYFNFGVKGLIYGTVLGHAAAMFVLLVVNIKVIKPFFATVSFNNIKAVAIEYKEFPKINSLHAFGDALRENGANVLIDNYFTQATLGWYGFMQRILRTPLSLISYSISQVFFQQTATMHANNESIQPLVKKVVKILTIGGLPCFIILMLFGKPIFSFVFGIEWAMAGWYAQILAPWLFVNLLVTPISHVPVVVNKQREVFLISLIGHSLFIGSILYAGLVANNFELGLYLISITQTVFLIFVVKWIIKISHSKGVNT